ncbi:hypothetical protein HKX48_004527 [Thoreauomyces humboldtii]|nr:hypothetical protein HKX48_004527 [Thoreauomyces humboldtii]
MTAGLFRAHLERNVELDEPRIPRKTVKVTYASRRQQASGTSSPKLSEVVDASCARPRDSSLEKDRSPGAVKRARKDGLLCIDNFFRPLAPVTVTKTPPSPAAPTPKLQKPATPNRTAEPPQVYEQLHLDLGQKGAGTVTCKDCHMEYAKYKSEDAAIHERYHRVAVNGVDWQGYKGEVVTDEHADGSRVVMVKSDCSQFLKKKVAEVVGIVNKDLGAVPTEPGASRNTVYDAFRVHTRVRLKESGRLRCSGEYHDSVSRIAIRRGSSKYRIVSVGLDTSPAAQYAGRAGYVRDQPGLGAQQ